MAKQVMHMQPGKGIDAALNNEIKRNWTDRAWDNAPTRGVYDRTRAPLNFEIVRGGRIVPLNCSKSIQETMAERLAERGIRDPNEGLDKPRFRTTVSFIFSGSQEPLRKMAFGDQSVDFTPGSDNSGMHRCKDIEEWASDVYKFVCDKWGEDNIVGFCVHLDETTPHIHCVLLPIDKDNRFAFKRLFAGRDVYELKERMRRLHDEFAEVNKKWGLERGDSVIETGAKHRSTTDYWRSLSGECTNLERQIDDHKATIRSLQTEISIAERRVKGLTTMVSNLEKKKEDLERKMLDLAEKIKYREGDVQDLLWQIARLDVDYQRTIDALEVKRESLRIAEEKLDELTQQKEDVKAERERAYKHLKKFDSDLIQQVRYRLIDGALAQIIPQFRQQFTQLDVENRLVFDGTFLRDFAENGEEIMGNAVRLFLNTMDDVTDIGTTGGGGSSGNDLPWGRKEDEDDLAYAIRCLQQSHKMLHSPRHSLRRK